MHEVLPYQPTHYRQCGFLFVEQREWLGDLFEEACEVVYLTYTK